MNSPNGHVSHSKAASRAGEAEETLRLISSLPAPVGLENRVKFAVRTARRRGGVLEWPVEFRSGGGWTHSTMARCAAAAAIVAVVAGGGWGLYSRVQPAPAPAAVLLPHVTASGGFSNAGAMRTPQTLNGTVLNHMAASQTIHSHATVKTRALAAKASHKSGKVNKSGKAH